MNESINWRSALASTLRYPVTRLPMGVRCVAWFTVLVFANLSAISFAQSSCPGIHVEILDIRNSTGVVLARFSKRQRAFLLSIGTPPPIS